MDNRPVGIFDSGLGGLTAVRALRALLPEEDFIYFAKMGFSSFPLCGMIWTRSVVKLSGPRS